MKRKYDSPEFELYELMLSDQIMNPSTKDEELVHGGPREDPIEE